jgi:hypothetical protein
MTPSLLIASGRNGRYRLKVFDGIPVVVPGLIFVEAGVDYDANYWAGLIEAELETVLLASGPNTSVSEVWESAANPASLKAFQEPLRQKLLVILCGGQPVADLAWFAPWLERKPDRAVLTVFRKGASPTALLPDGPLRALNAQFWDKSVTESVTAILSLAGLTLEDQRIFVSYRRLEAQPLAEQLFDALTHEGFDVFLDRFSIQPGINFQQRLTQELADKSMVLLIESAWAHSSEWTNHEIQFAKRYQLGLLSLQLPDRDEPLGSIDVDLRMKLESGRHLPADDPGAAKLQEHFLRDPVEISNPEYASKGKEPPQYRQWGPLTDEKLREVVAFAKSIHDRAVFRRRRFLRGNIAAALQKAGLNPDPVRSDGLMMVKGKLDYALWITTRPPELADFRTPHARVRPPGEKGVVVGPTAALESGRRDKLDWLRERCNFACIDTDDVPDAAERMKKGSL